MTKPNRVTPGGRNRRILANGRSSGGSDDKVAGHLGATMWTDDPETGQYGPAGGSERSTTCTMQRDVISLLNAGQDAYLAAVAAVTASGWPDYPAAAVRPGTIPAYFGEGSSLYAAGLGRSGRSPHVAALQHTAWPTAVPGGAGAGSRRGD